MCQSSYIRIIIIIINLWLIVPALELDSLGSVKWELQRKGQLGRCTQKICVNHFKQCLAYSILYRISFVITLIMDCQAGTQSGTLHSLCQLILTITGNGYFLYLIDKETETYSHLNSHSLMKYRYFVPTL